MSSFVHGLTLESFSAASTFAVVYGPFRTNRAARGEADAPAHLVEDASEPMILVVEHPLPVGELLEPDRAATGERGRA